MAKRGRRKNQPLSKKKENKYLRLINNIRELGAERGYDLKPLEVSTELAGQAKLDLIGVEIGQDPPGLVYVYADTIEAGVTALLNQRWDYRYNDHSCRSDKDCKGFLALMSEDAEKIGCAKYELGGVSVIGCQVFPLPDFSKKTY